MIRPKDIAVVALFLWFIWPKKEVTEVNFNITEPGFENLPVEDNS